MFIGINGEPGMVLRVDGAVRFVITLGIADDHIETVWIVVNPDKLVHAATAPGT